MAAGALVSRTQPRSPHGGEHRLALQSDLVSSGLPGNDTTFPVSYELLSTICDVPPEDGQGGHQVGGEPQELGGKAMVPGEHKGDPSLGNLVRL